MININAFEEIIENLFSSEDEKVNIEIDDKKIEKIAKICHNVNYACNLVFDNDSTLYEWDKAPKNQKESCINGVISHLKNPKLTPKKSHEVWMKNKKDQGWKFGPEKDGVKKTHPRMVPYEKLSKIEKLKDVLFSTLIDNLKDVIK